MISQKCSSRNQGIIPKLLAQHGAVLSGDKQTIDLSTAENWFLKQKLATRLKDASHSLILSEFDLSYSEGIGGDSQTRLMLSELLNHYFKPALPTEPSHFVLAAGGSFALSALVEQILDPGDGVLVATPYWPGLDICFNVHNNVEAIPVHIPLEAYFEAASIRYYEEALQNASVPVKGVLVCNPHNPLGRCYPKESLKTLMAFCKKNGLHYISNEVYGLSQHGDVDGESAFPQFVSVLGLEPQSESVHVIYSLSKDFGCNGIRLGALITKNDEIRLSAALSTHSQVSSISAWIATKYILLEENRASLIKEGQEQLKSAYKFIEDFLRWRDIAFFTATHGQFVFAKLLGPDKQSHMAEFSEALQRNGLAISSGLSYHLQEPGWFRICYAVPRIVLEEGLDRLDKCLCEVE